MSNYRALPMRIEPVGVFIIGHFTPDNRAFLPSYALPSSFSSFSSRIFLVLSLNRKEDMRETRARDDDILLSSYLWRIVRGTSRLSVRGKSLSAFQTINQSNKAGCTRTRFSYVILKASRKRMTRISSITSRVLRQPPLRPRCSE